MRPEFYQTRQTRQQSQQQQQQYQQYNSPRLRSPIINRSPVGNRSPVANRMPVAPKPAIKLSPRSDHRKTIALTLHSNEKCTPCPRCMFTAKFNRSTNEAKCSRCEHHYCVVCSHDYSKDFNVHHSCRATEPTTIPIPSAKPRPISTQNFTNYQATSQLTLDPEFLVTSQRAARAACTQASQYLNNNPPSSSKSTARSKSKRTQIKKL